MCGKQFLRKVVPIAIIDGFLICHFFHQSMLNIKRNRKPKPHFVHKCFGDSCTNNHVNGLSTFTKGYMEFNKFLCTTPEARNKATILGDKYLY